MTDPDVKAVVDRGFPLRAPRMSEAEIEEWGQEEPPRPTLYLGLCPGVGEVGIERDGILCCPSCGDPVAEGCGSSRLRRSDGIGAGSTKGDAV